MPNGANHDEERNRQIALAVYERAQEAAYHTDAVLWEATAIIWGGNTLLLGFILEALDKKEALRPIIWVSVIGLVLTIFVAIMWYVARITKSISYSTCRKIEARYQFPWHLRLHSVIHRFYPKAIATNCAYFISACFVCMWLYVILHACRLLHPVASIQGIPLSVFQ